MLTLKRRLYQLILRLHPTPFRDRFAREMSLDFEDALATFGFPRLLADAAGSLGRQWTAAPISFARTAPAATPAPLHPLLAGQYIVLEGDPLTPWELLRGTLLFAVMLFLLSLVLSHGGNYIHAGHLPGLPTNQTKTLQRPQDGPFQPRPGDPARNAVLIHPDRNLSLHPESARYFVRPQGHSRGADPLPETWESLLLRCAIITAIVWLTSVLVRRSRGIGVRIALVAFGTIAIVAAAAYIPAPAPPAHAQVLPGKFALVDYPQATPPQPLRDLSFQAATIQLQRTSGTPTPASANAAATGLVSEDSIRITLPIRSLIASVSGMPGSPAHVLGGPGWLDSDTYDIEARIDSTQLAAMRQMSPGQQQYQIDLMEQSLLVTRFHLKAHEEARTLPGSTLPQPVKVLVIDHIDRPSEN